MDYIIARMKEPSTFAAIAALLAALHVNIPPDEWKSLVSVLTGLAGLAAILMRETGSKSLTGTELQPNAIPQER